VLILNNLETALKLCIFDGLFRLECKFGGALLLRDGARKTAQAEACATKEKRQLEAGGTEMDCYLQGSVAHM
jgi:hypothetical protein